MKQLLKNIYNEQNKSYYASLSYYSAFSALTLVCFLSFCSMISFFSMNLILCINYINSLVSINTINCILCYNSIYDYYCLNNWNKAIYATWRTKCFFDNFNSFSKVHLSISFDKNKHANNTKTKAGKRDVIAKWLKWWQKFFQTREFVFLCKNFFKTFKAYLLCLILQIGLNLSL